MHHRSTILIMGVIIGAGLITSSTVQAKKDGLIIAKSSVADPAARQIVRSVANESLKTISTKDSALTNGLIVERLEDGEPALPAKVQMEPAPGSRKPAATQITAAKIDVPPPGTHAHDATDDSDHDSHHDAPAESHATSAHNETPHVPASVAEATVTNKAKPALETTVTAKSAAPAAHLEAKGVSPEQAVSWLQNGNKRYLKKTNRADGKSQADRDRLVKGQKPHTIVLSCSDSRVPPETVFDQSLGEIFVIRTAGEAIDSAVLASIEYAVEHLGPRLLVVMGHTSCGAVAATISSKDGVSVGSPSLDALVADIRPRLPGRGPAGVSSQNLEIESSANAQGVAADLVKRSDIIRARVEKGDLVIKPALYHLDSGVVKFY